MGSIYHLASRGPSPRYNYDTGDLAAAAGRGALIGVVAGAGLGSAGGMEHWDRVPLPLPDTDALPEPARRTAVQTRVRLGRFDADALHIDGDDPLRISVDSIVAIEERRAKTGSWLRRGALIGGALGLGTVAFHAIRDDDGCSEFERCSTPWAPITIAFGAGGAFAGGTIGAIIGSYLRGWQPQRW